MNNQDAEYYFIQFLFCKSPDLLRKDYRDIYDAMFKHYEKIYQEGRNSGIDLLTINNTFMAKFKP